MLELYSKEITIVAVLAVISGIFRMSSKPALQNIAFANYLIMGWLVIFVIDEIVMPNVSFKLLVAGGISYTVGVLFYLWEKLPFNHSIWHLFVSAGSTSHYFAIYNMLA